MFLFTDQTYWAGFYFTKNISLSLFKKIISYFPSGYDAWHSQNKDLLNAGIPQTKINALRNEQSQINLNILEQTFAREKINSILYGKENYPLSLKNINAAPAILFYKGNIKLLKNMQTNIAIVGTRKATDYGLEQSKLIAEALSDNGLNVVSGLAQGIDLAAHKGALKAKGNTIAVLATNLCSKAIYPRIAKPLIPQITQKGLLVSEYPPLYPCQKTHFPQRNRIIAGLSCTTLVIEAPKKSGAMITAFLALNQNKEIWALPGNINRTNSDGTNYLIKLGAKIITKEQDMFEYLNISHTQKHQTRLNLTPKNPSQTTIIKLLNQSTLPLDILLLKTKLPPKILHQELFNLEMDGLLTLKGGKYQLTK